MAIKSEDFMKEITSIVENGGRFDGLFYVNGDYGKPHAQYNCGNSYDGFINYTDGFVDISAYYTPREDEHIHLVGVDEVSKKNAANVQKVIDALENDVSVSVEDYFNFILPSDHPEFDGKWEDAEEFVNWYDSYVPNDGHYNQLDLFTGEPVFTRTSDPALDELYESVNNSIYSYYDEKPAFVGITLRLYDTDNSRNLTSSDKREHECILESYFNDDLEYGRENVGDWAGKNIIGNNFGKQVVYSNEFTWTDFEDLKAKLKERIGNAYKTLGF